MPMPALYPKTSMSAYAILLLALCVPIGAQAEEFSVQNISVAVQDQALVEEGAQGLAAIVEDVSSDNVPAPEQDQLKFESGEAELDTMLGLEDDSPTISGPSADGSQQFFDAESLVPQGEMAKAGPKKVDPVLQPASKLIIVRKNYASDSYTAKLVSAERAMKLGLYDSAVLILDELQKKNKLDPRVSMTRAIALQKLGRFDEAMKAYELTSNIDQDNIEVKINMLGLLGSKYPSIALRRLLDLREKNQEHVGLVAQIAVIQAQLGDFRGGLQYLGMAASMEPSNASHIFNMAVISDRIGDTAKAVSYYEKALELDTMYGASKTVPREAIYERLAQIR